MTSPNYEDVADAMGKDGLGVILPFVSFEIIEVRPIVTPSGSDATDLLIETPVGGQTCRMHLWLEGLFYTDVAAHIEAARRMRSAIRLEAVQMRERHPVDGKRWWLGWIKINGQFAENAS